jgi:hypothetical protein
MQFKTKIILLVSIAVLGGAFFVSAAEDSGGGGGGGESSYARIHISESSKNIIVGQEIFIQANIKAGDESTYLSGCKINFGDGEELTNFCQHLKPGQICTKNVSHSYDSPRDYTVKVSCGSYSTASGGAMIKDEEIVKVSAKPILDPSVDEDFNPLEANTLDGIVKSLTGLAFSILSGLAVIFVMIGGFYILTAGGSPDQLKKGKKIILFTIIGFSVVMAATGIRALIYKILEIDL